MDILSKEERDKKVIDDFNNKLSRRQIYDRHSIGRATYLRILDAAGIPKEQSRRAIPPHVLRNVMSRDNKKQIENKGQNVTIPTIKDQDYVSIGGIKTMEKDIQREIDQTVKLMKYEILDELRKSIEESKKDSGSNRDQILNQLSTLVNGVAESKHLGSEAQNQANRLAQMVDLMKAEMTRIPDIPKNVAEALPGVIKKVKELPEDLCKKWPDVCRILRNPSHTPSSDHRTIKEVMECPECEGNEWVLNNLDMFTKDEKGQEALAEALREAGFVVQRNEKEPERYEVDKEEFEEELIV